MSLLREEIGKKAEERRVKANGKKKVLINPSQIKKYKFNLGHKMKIIWALPQNFHPNMPISFLSHILFTYINKIVPLEFRVHILVK